jgi:hypothetical protein
LEAGRMRLEYKRWGVRNIFRGEKNSVERYSIASIEEAIEEKMNI